MTKKLRSVWHQYMIPLQYWQFEIEKVLHETPRSIFAILLLWYVLILYSSLFVRLHVCTLYTGNIYALRVNMSVAVVAMVNNYTVVVNGTEITVSHKQSISTRLFICDSSSVSLHLFIKTPIILQEFIIIMRLASYRIPYKTWGFLVFWEKAFISLCMVYLQS